MFEEELLERIYQGVSKRLRASNDSRTFYTQSVLVGQNTGSNDLTGYLQCVSGSGNDGTADSNASKKRKDREDHDFDSSEPSHGVDIGMGSNSDVTFGGNNHDSVTLYGKPGEQLECSPYDDRNVSEDVEDHEGITTRDASSISANVTDNRSTILQHNEGDPEANQSEKNNVKFMTGHMLRFSPLLQRMKEIVNAGIIGEITFVQSHFVYNAQLSQRKWLLDKKNAGAGPLFDIGIHCLDSMRFVLNDDHIVNVNNMMNPQHTETEVEKTSLLSFQFSKGTIGTVYSSYESSYRQSFIEFFGTKGSISAFYFTPSNTQATVEIKMGKEGLIDSIQREEISVPNLYELEISHFSDCILNDTSPIVDAKNSLHNQQILELALNQ